jgi:hypothetical protein
VFSFWVELDFARVHVDIVGEYVLLKNIILCEYSYTFITITYSETYYHLW